MDLSWLQFTRLYFKERDDAYLIIGTKNNPRSTFINIHGEIDEAKYFPPTPIEYLEKIYNPNITLNNCQLKNSFKLTLSIILREKIELTDNYLHYNDDLLNWIENSHVCREIYYFVEIISSNKRIARQHALYSLISERSETSIILLNSLVEFREEITSSVFREMGRWNVKSEKIIHYAQNLDTNDSTSWYAKMFLVNNKLDKVKTDEMIEYSFSLIKKVNSQRTMKKMLREDPSNLLMGLVHLSTSDHKLFSKVIKSITSMKLTGVPYRRALMKVIKYAEMMQSSILVGGLLCLTLTDRSVDIIDGVQSISMSNEEAISYPRQRLLSLIRIWDKTDRHKEVDEILLFTIMHLPNEKTIFKKSRYKYLDTIQWVESHPIFSIYEERIQLLIYNNQDLLSDVMIHISLFENILFNTWLLRNIQLDIIKTVIAELDFNSKLYVYSTSYYYPKRFNLLYHIKKGRKTSDLNYCDYYPDESSIKKTLGYFYRLKFVLPIRIFQQIVEYMHSDLFEAINLKDLLDKYLKKIIVKDEKTAMVYANVILKYIIDNKHSNCQFCINQMNYLINWKKYTGYSIPQKWEDIIHGIKLANSDILDNIGIDAITPIAVKTITTCFDIMNGMIHPIIENSIQFSLNKYNWDQLARYYLAMGIKRPKREALLNSELKNIPKMLLRDQLGRIALVSQTINYCIEYGFISGLERVIVSNIYMRGWNVDNNLKNKMIKIIGSVGFKLRSYISAYLILEKSEVSDEILLLARDIDSKIIRDRLLRTLERFGSANMWFILSGSTYEDLSSSALEQLKRLRMGKEDRLNLIQRMLNAENYELRKLGIDWVNKQEFTDDEVRPIFTSIYEDTWPCILDYYEFHKRYINENYPKYHETVRLMLWEPRLRKNTNERLIKIAIRFDDLKETLYDISESMIKSRADTVIHEIAEDIL